MPKIMKSMNIISRCQAAYRNERLDELPACHHTFVLSICRAPGRTQEEIASDIRLNKSTVARTLEKLEEKGYIRREPNPDDKRALLVYPTQKMSDILPAVRALTSEWNDLITSDISKEEMAIFESVVARMEKSARAAIDKLEEAKR